MDKNCKKSSSPLKKRDRSILTFSLKKNLSALKIVCKSLKNQSLSLDKEIAELRATGETGDISLEKQALHDYMDIKDAAQKIIGCLINLKGGCRIAKVYKRYNAPLDDN